MNIDAINDPEHPFTNALNDVMHAAAETSFNPAASVSRIFCSKQNLGGCLWQEGIGPKSALVRLIISRAFSSLIWRGIKQKSKSCTEVTHSHLTIPTWFFQGGNENPWNWKTSIPLRKTEKSPVSAVIRPVTRRRKSIDRYLYIGCVVGKKTAAGQISDKKQQSQKRIHTEGGGPQKTADSGRFQIPSPFNLCFSWKWKCYGRVRRCPTIPTFDSHACICCVFLFWKTLDHWIERKHKKVLSPSLAAQWCLRAMNFFFWNPCSLA